MTVALSHGTGPVLAAVDFSEDSRLALGCAARQAQLEGVALVILHVVHDPAASPGYYRKPEENWLRPMIDAAQAMMRDFLSQAKAMNPDVPEFEAGEVRLVSGLPAGRIIEVAEDTQSALIVVGRRGRTGLKEVLLGSVAERVAQLSSVPVVIVKSPAPGPRN